MNYHKVIHKYFVSLGLPVVVSFSVFFIAIAFHFLIGYIVSLFINLDGLDTITFEGFTLKNFLLTITITVISPILMFKGYRFLFKIEKNRNFKILKLSVIIILFVIGLVVPNFGSGELTSMIWQFVMALSLQLILYQYELKAVVASKHNNSQ